MDIYRHQSHGLTVLEAMRKQGVQQTPAPAASSAPPRRPLDDRRLRPDRRRLQLAFQGQDRRRRHSRRNPALLHHHTRQPIPIEDRRGKVINTRA